jgi:hypothetical protein
MSLAQREAWFWHGVRSCHPPSDADAVIAARPGLSARRRLEIYRAAYFARQFRVLEETFPRAAELLGRDRFREIAEAYLEERPSSAPAIEWVGEALVDFLLVVRQPVLPAVVDVARLEWARHCALLAPEAERTLPPEELARGLAGADRLRFAPALTLLRVAHDAPALWARHAPGPDGDRGRVSLAVWRRRFSVTHARLAEDEAAALASAMKGSTFDATCTSFSEPHAVERASEVVAGWIRRRWLVALGSVVLAMATLGCGGPEPLPFGFETGAAMKPGEDCSRCHWAGSDYPTAPRFTAAGTVFPAPDAPATSGVSGVSVELSEPGGSVLLTLVTNSVGNFYTTTSLPDGFRVALVHGGQRVEMPCPPPAGNCGACHSLPPIGETQGRIFVPGGATLREPPLDCESWTRSPP